MTGKILNDGARIVGFCRLELVDEKEQGDFPSWLSLDYSYYRGRFLKFPRRCLYCMLTEQIYKGEELINLKWKWKGLVGLLRLARSAHPTRFCQLSCRNFSLMRCLSTIFISYLNYPLLYFRKLDDII